MKTNKFLSLVLTLTMVLTATVQGLAFTAAAKESTNELILGDANLDFSVNVKDATNIQKSAAKITLFGNLATETADVDENKTINVKDATNVQKWTAQCNVPYNVGKSFEFKSEVTPGISLKEATDAALEYANAAYEDVVFDDKDYEVEGGTAYYEIEFSANGYEYEVTVNAEDGKVVNCEKEVDDDYRKPATPEKPKPQAKPEATKPAETKPQTNNFIDVEVAKDKALNHAGVTAENARFDRTELDKDNGRYKYEIEFEADGFEYEYEIDAVSGDVLDFEKDRADD